MAPNTTPPAGELRPGDRVTFDVDAVGAGGVGVGRVDGLTVLVPRALPGERVEVAIVRRRRAYAQGRVLTVVRSVPLRGVPPCPHFDLCNGCDWQHADAAAQLTFKRQVAEDQLRRIGRLTPPPEWRIAPAAQTLHYRDRVEFSFLATGAGTRPAFHAFAAEGAKDDDDESVEVPSPASLTPITDCKLVPPGHMRAALALAGWLDRALPRRGRGAKPPVYRLTVQGDAPQPAPGVPSEGGGGISLLLHAADADVARQLQRLGEALAAHLRGAAPAVRHVAVEFRQQRGRRRARSVILLGEATIGKQVGGRHWRVPPGAFFQVHASMAGQLLEAVLAEARGDTPRPDGDAGDAPDSSHAPRAPQALDLFCGVGFITLPLAQAGYDVLGVDVAEEAVLAAGDNARRWGLPQARFAAAHLGRPGALRRLLRDEPPPALIVVDPPRQGLPRELTTQLLSLDAPRLLYVSCDGGTFARDAARLAPRYRLTALRGFDMFPQTHHLELLGRFTRLPG
ncbi:MAG: class I SAM-dependent RNA methyltransferase [Candidatus Lambdaproteobacteria bacterium]|nr:class I SAM-dependent RNA methyltransferase [Candidatus Lambdaproteobacteria bacterium]